MVLDVIYDETSGKCNQPFTKGGIVVKVLSQYSISEQDAVGAFGWLEENGYIAPNTFRSHMLTREGALEVEDRRRNSGG